LFSHFAPNCDVTYREPQAKNENFSFHPKKNFFFRESAEGLNSLALAASELWPSTSVASAGVRVRERFASS